MSRLNSFFAMGGAGYSGAYLYSNRDLLDDLLGGSKLGFAPSNQNASFGELEGLRREISDLKHSQRSANTTLVIANRPTTILGMPLWKVTGTVGVIAIIYWKLCGYEMRDLVYVSRKHFTNVFDSLKEQFGVMQETLGTVKAEVIQRFHVVETKLNETREALESLIGFRFGKVEQKIDILSSELDNTNIQLAKNNGHLEQISGDLIDVRSHISMVSGQLDRRILRVQNSVGEFKESEENNFSKISDEATNIDSKIERLSLQTSSQVLSLQSNIEESQKGIDLLCEFVVSQAQTPSQNTNEGQTASKPDVAHSRKTSLNNLNRLGRASFGNPSIVNPLAGF